MRLIWITTLLLISCSGQRETTKQEDAKLGYFKNTFLKKFKILQLPCDIGEGKGVASKNLPTTDPKTLDSLFTQSTSVTLLCYGMLSDTARFYTLVFYAPAVTYVPVLVTFDKNGSKIHDRSVDFGCWDGGPDNYECDGHLTVDKNLNLNFEHVTTCYGCDSTSTAPKLYIDKGKGKIGKDGQIKLNIIRN